MKTITLEVPDFLNDSLETAASRRRQSKSELIREMLVKSLAGETMAPSPDSGKPTIQERLAGYLGAGPTGIKDLASNPAHLSGYGV